MSTQVGPKSTAPTYTLTSLPHDVLLHLLEHLTPTQVAAYAQLSCATATAAADPYIWASVARRHLGVAPPHTNTLSAPAVSRLATNLVCRWWVATGTFVSGVPVHFRRGFAEVRARGGAEVPVKHDRPETCYVFGGRHKDAAVPVPIPSISLDFAMDPAGPFPMDGMRLRLIHASEPVDQRSAQPVQPNNWTPAPLTTSHMTDIFLSPPAFDTPSEATHSPPRDRARIRIKLNNTTVVDAAEPDPDVFSVLDVCIGPELLRTKPRRNTLVIEYDRSSTAAYWVKEISLVPSILPAKIVAKDDLVFDVRQTSLPKAVVPPPPVLSKGKKKTAAPTERVPGGRGGRRRSQQQRHERTDALPTVHQSIRELTAESSKLLLGEVPTSVRGQKGEKVHRKGRMPKHAYHQNGHKRSPRGTAPSSPGKARAGR